MSNKKPETVSEVKPEVKKLSVADQIWNQIKDLELPLFALPGKSVAEYCERVDIAPHKLFLRLKVPAALPMLDSMLEKKFKVEMGTLYCEITPKD